MSAAVQQPAINAKGTWRGFSTTETNFIKAEFPDKIEGPSAWVGKELEKSPEDYIYRLSPEDIADIEAGLKHFNSLNLPLTEISKENFPLTSFKTVIKDQLHGLFHGYGFSVVRGLDVLKYERKDQAAIFLGIGAYMGSFKPQNGKGHILGHVKDLTYGSTTKGIYDPDAPTTRRYITRQRQPFHVDGTDIVSLLCLSEAHEGGLSSVISSHTVYNRLRELRPDIAELLKEPWLWDRMDEQAPGEPPYVAAAPMTFHKGHLFTAWSPHFLETVVRFPEVKLDEKKLSAIRYVQELCEREALNMKLEIGDIQFVQNYQIMHARTAYTDKPEATRHLLRMWLLVNQEEVGWEMPFAKSDFDYSHTKRSAPLEAE